MDRTLIGILGGLGGMLGWGTSDFLANITSEKIGHFKAFFWSQVAGAALILLAILLFRPEFHFTPLLLGLTLFSGVAYTAGYLLFYRGFEIGNISVVSAVINMQVLFVILIAFFLRGQQLTLIQVPALALVMLGVLLVSVNFQDFRRTKTIALLKGFKETFLAAVIFGILYWPLNEVIVEQVHFLVVSFLVKVTAILTVFIISLTSQRQLKLDSLSKNILPALIGMGFLEALGILATSYGITHGDIILVSPISSALTVVTVALAVIFLKEKVSRVQLLGIAMTVAGIVLTAF
mgnify:CR=1 FL=1